VKICAIRVKVFLIKKSQKKKVAFPGRTWQINPVTRVEWDLQKQDWQGYAAARPAERQVSPTVTKLK
jgi:hypothetical protein